MSDEIKDYRFEAVTLRLAERTTYTPDFMVIYSQGLPEFIEIKGFSRDDARAKFKVTSSLFPWFVFTWIQLRKKRGVFEVINHESWLAGSKQP